MSVDLGNVIKGRECNAWIRMDQAGIVVPVKLAGGSWLRVDGTIRARIAAVGSRILSFEFRKLEGLPDIA